MTTKNRRALGARSWALVFLVPCIVGCGAPFDRFGATEATTQSCTAQFVPPDFACSFKRTTPGGYYQGDYYVFLHTWRASLEVGLPSKLSKADATFTFPTPVTGGTTGSIAGNINFVAYPGQSLVKARVQLGARAFNVAVVAHGPGICRSTITHSDGTTVTVNRCSISIGQMYYSAPLEGPLTITFTKIALKVGTFSMKIDGQYHDPPPALTNASLPPVPSTDLFPGCAFDPVSGIGSCVGTSEPETGWGTCTWHTEMKGLRIEGDLDIEVRELTDPHANCPVPFPRAAHIVRLGGPTTYMAEVNALTSSSIDFYACSVMPTNGSLCFNEVLAGTKGGIPANTNPFLFTPLGSEDGTMIGYEKPVLASGIDAGLNVDLPDSLPSHFHAHFSIELADIVP